MNELQQSTLFNGPAFVIFDFSKIAKIGSEFNNKKHTPSTISVLKSKKLQLTILVVLGILGYRFISSRFIGKDQKTVKSEMRQIQQKGFDETIVRPPGTKYDPSIDYGELVWQSYYESHKGEEFAEEMKKTMEYYNHETYWDSEEGVSYSILANNNIM